MSGLMCRRFLPHKPSFCYFISLKFFYGVAYIHFHGWYSVLIMERMLTCNLPLKPKPLPVVLNTHLPLGTGDKQMQLVQELECRRFEPFYLLFF